MTQRIVCPTAASSSLSLPTLPDNPRAAGAAPFSMGELLATARSVQFFHSSSVGVVLVSATPLLIWFFGNGSNHPAAGCGRGFPSLSKEGSLNPDFPGGLGYLSA